MEDQSGPYVPNQTPPPSDQMLKPHRGTLILVLGILSIVMSLIGGVVCLVGWIAGLPCGIIAWVIGGRDLRAIDAGTMDPLGMGSTKSGWICGIIGTIIGILCAILTILMIIGIASGAIRP